MVRTLSVVSQKGGSGKTTLAVALAVAHGKAGGRSFLIDLDPQGSVVTWKRLRGDKIPPAVVPAHPPRLARVVNAAVRSGADLVVIDTAPRESAGTAAAARLSDRVLIPCRPSAVDLATIPATLAVLGGPATASAAVVLNACPPRGPWVAEAVEAVRALGAALCPRVLGARVAHARAFTAGRTAMETEPRSPAAIETELLYRWTMERTQT